MSLFFKGNVKVQDTVFSLSLSGNWNVSFFSVALQLRLDLVGTEHGMGNLNLKCFIYGLYMLIEALVFYIYLQCIKS